MSFAAVGLLILAPVALAGDAMECHRCAMTFDRQDVVYWGTKTFCSKECKDDFWQEYNDKQWRCKHCGTRVDPPSRVTSDGMYTYINLGPSTWDGYCDECRDGIKSGALDPKKKMHLDSAPEAGYMDGEEDEEQDPVLEQALVRKPAGTQDQEDLGKGFLWVLLGVLAVGVVAWKLLV